MNQSNAIVPNGTQVITRSAQDLTREARIMQVQAEIMARYRMALEFPRDPLKLETTLVQRCESPDYAKSVLYRKPAGNKTIDGLGIRFAEDATALIRNVLIDTQPEMEDDEHVSYRVTITDIQNNTTSCETLKVSKVVERREVPKGEQPIYTRINSKGETVHGIRAHEDQVLTKLRAQISRVRRGLILGLVPPHVKARCLEICKQVVADETAKDPEAAKKSVVLGFAQIGVTADDLKEYLGHAVGSVTPREIDELRGVYVLLKDGEITWADALDARQEDRANQSSRKAFIQEKNAERQRRGAAQGDKTKPEERSNSRRSAQVPPKPPKSKPPETIEPTEPTPQRASRRGDSASAAAAAQVTTSSTDPSPDPSEDPSGDPSLLAEPTE